MRRGLSALVSRASALLAAIDHPRHSARRVGIVSVLGYSAFLVGSKRGRLTARRRGYGRNVGCRNAGQTETGASPPDSVEIDTPSDA